MTQQNIMLPIGEHGYVLKIVQDPNYREYAGSYKDFKVDVALIDTLGERHDCFDDRRYVKLDHWWYGNTCQETQGNYYDDMVSDIDVKNLEFVIGKARRWIKHFG